MIMQREKAPEVNALVHPNSDRSGLKNTPKHNRALKDTVKMINATATTM